MLMSAFVIREMSLKFLSSKKGHTVFLFTKKSKAKELQFKLLIVCEYNLPLSIIPRRKSKYSLYTDNSRTCQSFQRHFYLHMLLKNK